MATITFVDERRQWFKSTVGLQIRETDRSIAFCAQAINQSELFLVYDAKVHPMFRTYPQVIEDHGLRFYAGMPLISPEGFAIGTLAVMDRVPRSLTKEQSEALQILAAEVMAQLELRRQSFQLVSMAAERDRINLLLRYQAEHLNQAQRIAQVGSWELNIQENRLLWSEEVYRIFAIEHEEFGENFEAFLAFLHPDDSKKFLAERERVLSGAGPMHIEHRIILKDGSVKHILELGELSRDDSGAPLVLSGTVQDITERHRLETFKREQNAILESIASGAGLQEVLKAAVQLVEEQYPAVLCSVLMLDEEGKHLGNGVAEKLPAEYMQALEGVMIGPNVGSCGTAAFTGKNVIVSDIANDPLWVDYRDLALKYGLASCWSIPILSSANKVLGTFAVYSHVPYTPSASELELVGSCSHVVGIAIERHKSQQNLKLLETSISRLNDIVLITEAEPIDEPGPRILFVNDAFERRTGYTRDEVIGKTPRILQGEKTQRSELDRIRAALEKWEPVRAELINYTKSGEEFWIELDIVPVADASGWYTHWVSIEREITERKMAEEEIRQLAFYDHLTQLPNRRLLLDRLKHALAFNARNHMHGALLFIDLDNFKVLNDTQGHDKGDLLLQQVAGRLSASVREHNTVARLGGDEFLVMLTELSENPQEAANEAKIVGERILTSFVEPYQLDTYEHHSTPSIGIALFSDERVPVEELLKRADLAMYQSKAQGRNTMRFFDPKMQTAVSERVAMEESLRQALRNREFSLYYQPQIEGEDLFTGAEALIRWKHPERGMVSPAEFIPLAEDTGLILPLGQWVLETACVQLQKWADKAETSGLSLAVNVSVHQYRQHDFVERVTQALDDSGANPHRLKLELTESLLVDDLEDIIEKMTALKAKGVSFSLDDFGTGYSSLSYLKRLPLGQLKIDQSFVRDVLTDPNDAAIARTIVALGQSLGLAVIAEGVETEEQRQFLASHGCHAYQGYLFSKPLPIEEFETLLHAKISVKTS
jgi:diguanylate cyclase (GGDEF)-like protein/PAS domain S-box-containing protein